MSLYVGRFEHVIDRSGRVVVPAPWRAESWGSKIAQIGLYRSPEGPWLVALPGHYLENVLDRGLDERAVRSLASHLAYSHPLSFDKKGRVTLPKDHLVHAHILTMAHFVGVSCTFLISGTKLKCSRETGFWAG